MEAVSVTKLRKQYAEAYELERGGYLVKDNKGKWIVLDEHGKEWKA